MTKTQKGFTLIELLVVIAIIGILAGILFVAINPKAQTDKANDAKVKSELASVRTQAALVFSGEADPTTGFDKVCDNANVKELIGATGACKDSSTGWAASKQLVSDTTKYWCVDSNGATKQIGANVTETAC